MPIHLHSNVTATHLQQRVVQASIPVACVIAWHHGWLLLNNFPASNLPGWPDWLLRDYLNGLTTIAPETPIVCFVVGAIYLAPTIVGLCLVAWGWSALFAALRERPIDPGWLVTGWLFALLAPMHVSFGLLAIACSFGLVFGLLVFGGSGRHVVSPVLLAAVFLQLSYPQHLQPLLVHATESGGALPHSSAFSAWVAAACALGAFWLVRNNTLSARILMGGVGAALLTAWVLVATDTSGAAGFVPWYSHLLMGNSAFVLAFLLTDPGCAPHTRSGRWALGVVFGTLLVVLRTLDAAHPEASTTAALLAVLLVPLVDHFHVSRSAKRLAMP